MNRVLFYISLFFSLFWANAQNNEVWYTGNHEMVRGVKEARDHSVWMFCFDGVVGVNGSKLKKISRNGEVLLTIQFADYLVLDDIYEYENGNIFFSINTNDPSIKSPQGAGVFMFYDALGNKIKEHVYLPHPDSLYLYSKLDFGVIRDVVPVDEGNSETDLILLGYNSIGWDDPENPGSDFFLGSMVGIERIDSQGNRIWTRRITQFFNWGQPSLINLNDGNILITTNAAIFPNSPDSTTDYHDGVVLLKMDVDGNVIWQNNTLAIYNSEYITTRPEKTVELPNGKFVVPISLSPSSPVSTWFTGLLRVSDDGLTTGYSFVGDTSKQVGKTQLEYLDSNRLIYACKYNLTGQGYGLPPLNTNYNVYIIDTLGNTIKIGRASCRERVYAPV